MNFLSITRRLTALAAMLLITTTAAQAATATDWVGYGGPGGTRVYPDATPPTKFGDADVIWKTEIPELGWGHGSPIVVSNLVIIAAEYDERHNAFPSLLAFNTGDPSSSDDSAAAGGSLAWSALLDHTPALKNGERIKTLWLKVIADNLKRVELGKEFRAFGKSAEKKKEIEAMGYKVNSRWGIVSGGKALPKWEWDELRKAAFSLETWRSGNVGKADWCVGQMYATPVSDGKRIYVSTAFGGFFAFDLDGEQLWCAASPGQQGEYCRNARSPILWTDHETGKTLLLSDITNKVRAFDAETGELLWADEVNAHSVVTPAVLTVAGTPILWAAGCNAYRLPDGKKLTVEGWHTGDHGMQSLVKHDEPDVLFLCGVSEHCGWRGKGGMNKPHPDHFAPAALRFTLAEDVLKATVLWEGRDLEAKWTSRVGGGNSPWMLYDDGKFYHREGAIYEALTGKRIAGKIYSKGRGAVPETSHLLCRAGNHIYGLKNAGDKKHQHAVIGVWTPDGKRVAVNKLSNPLGRGYFSYGCTFTFDKSSIYVRSLRHIMRIGK